MDLLRLKTLQHAVSSVPLHISASIMILSLFLLERKLSPIYIMAFTIHHVQPEVRLMAMMNDIAIRHRTEV